ncbi:uncharacterized protein LOC122381382 [Amphibalanus amphitrite]|uniref:uncharacterized protein LOC122381382 n=1 Tax=Amphibalanus amphitrite TaxID=1232801 RepID=UPI001C91018B|nr:uncharacterized protein LOC122381382 [Amphibalanus amphitrite]
MIKQAMSTLVRQDEDAVRPSSIRSAPRKSSKAWQVCRAPQSTSRMPSSIHEDDLESGREDFSSKEIKGDNDRRGGRALKALLRSVAVLVFRWTVHIFLLVFLGQQLYSQYQDYDSQPVSSTVLRRQAPFPRLTLCPGTPLRDTVIRLEAETLLTSDNVTLDQFYNISTLQMLGSDARYNNWPNRIHVESGAHAVGNVPGRSRLGTWGARYYLTLSRLRHKVHPTRCLTFEPSEYLFARSKNPLQLELILASAPSFTETKRTAYRLFVHGSEEPNVGDLVAQELGPHVPQTLVRELGVGSTLSLRLTARLLRQVNVRLRPCRDDPGYSETQCLKECLWRRLAANISCRLPHMVGAGVYLPDMSGPLDHLPLCARPVQMQTSMRTRVIRFCTRQSNEKCQELRVRPWYRPDGSAPLIPGPTALVKRSDSSMSPSLNLSSSFSANATHSREHEPMKAVSKLRVFNLCNPPHDLETFVENNLLTDVRGCNCQPACHQTLYDLYGVSGPTRDDQYHIGACQTRIALAIDLTADELREAIVFTSATLLANMGGLIGVVTGYSLFTLAGASETLVHKVVQRWH